MQLRKQLKWDWVLNLHCKLEPETRDRKQETGKSKTVGMGLAPIQAQTKIKIQQVLV